MTTIELPKISMPEEQVSRLGLGIVVTDQFDDWLPDCVYYRDIRAPSSDVEARVRQGLAAGQALDTRAPTTMKIPRAESGELMARSLPYALRLAAHCVIAHVASRSRGRLLRDKVFGFRYRNTGHPPFFVPGEGLAAAIQQAMNTADGSLVLLDVEAFNPSASLTRLVAQLQTNGQLTPTEAMFLEAVLRLPRGLPSVDDATAYLYNFYLSSVDQKLAEAKINFVRYRDEYFVFRDYAPRKLLDALEEMSLRGKVKLRHDDIRQEVVDLALEDLGSPDHVPRAGKTFQARWARFQAEAECRSWDGGTCSDGFELDVSVEAAGQAARIEAWAPRPPAKADGVRLLPALREFHRVRRRTAPKMPNECDGPRFLKQRAKLTERRGVILDNAHKALVQRGDYWTVSWSSRALSDLGQLEPAEAKFLREVAANPTAPRYARAECRVALARTAEDPDISLWSVPSATASEHELRCAALEASFWARRGKSGPSDALRDQLTDRTALVDYLKGP